MEDFDDETIDIEDVADTGDFLPLDEEYEDMILEEDKYLSTVIDYSQTMEKINKPNRTIPFMTKYEKTKLLGIRMQQLNTGAPPTISTKGLKNTNEIAKEELKSKKLPLLIRRIMPDGSHDDCDIRYLGI